MVTKVVMGQKGRLPVNGAQQNRGRGQEATPVCAMQATLSTQYELLIVLIWMSALLRKAAHPFASLWEDSV